MTSAPSPQPARRSRLGRWRPAVVVGVLLVLGAASATSWASWTSAVATDVSVAALGAPACEGATFRTENVGTGDDEVLDVLLVTPRTRCEYTLRITNGSASSVHLEQVVLPYLGPDGGGVLRFEPAVATGDVDAVVPLDRELGSGETTEVQVVVGYRPRGCTSALTWLDPWTRVDLSVAGRDITILGADTLAFTYHRDRNPGCRGG